MKVAQYTCKCGKRMKLEIITSGHDMMAYYRLCEKCYLIKVREDHDKNK